MRKYLSFLLLLLTTASYAQTNNTKAIKKAGISSWYILPANRNIRVPKPNEFFEVDYRMSIGSNDSLLNETFSGGQHVNLPVNHPSFKHIFSEARTGDRLEIVIHIDSFYKNTMKMPVPSIFKRGDSIRFYMKIYEILTYEEMMRKQMQQTDDQKQVDSAEFFRYMSGYRNVQQTERGLHYMVSRYGTGEQPRSGDSVTINYRGYFMDGKVFDKDDGYKFIAGLGQVIAGLDEAVLLMKTGTKMKLFIPYYLAYGSEGTKNIPEYSSLIFDVELISVKRNHY